jgi:hypothetical protein
MAEPGRGVRPLRSPGGRLSGLLLALLLLALTTGCVEVETRVDRRGYITREICIEAPDALADVVREGLKDHFENDWQITRKRRDETVLFIIKHKDGKQAPEDILGVDLEMSYTGTEQRYRYTEAIRISRYLTEDTIQKHFADTEFVMRIRMPGKITNCAPLTRADTPTDDTAVFRWKLEDLAKGTQYTISVESAAKRLDKGFLVWMIGILVVGALVSVVTSSGPWAFFTRVFRNEDEGDDL